MAGLHLYRSNRLEALAEALAAITRAPLPSVFTRETIVVQSLGMRRWLSLELAQRHGVVANVAFPFPGEFVQSMFDAVLGKSGDRTAFDRAVLPWRILALLPSIMERSGGEELARYIAGEMRDLKSFQLAGKIAHVFDRYLAYRPQLILEWQQRRTTGDDVHWQEELWRELSRGREAAHSPEMAREFSERLGRGAFDPQALPVRVCIFGISSLPPFYIQLFGEFARQLDVHLFALEPTPEFWSDLRSLKEQDRMARSFSHTAAELHLEAGNPLLSSLGKIGREFSDAIQSLDPTAEHELFAAPDERSLLGQVQSDIFHLRSRETEGDEPLRIVAAEDHSIHVHCCHSPMREIEVLHDQLLAMFERDPALTPKEIVVTMPDVERYAPFIEAVFGAPESRELAIPFTIADRSVRAENCLADTLLDLLDLSTSRFGAASVLALLDTRPVRRRFELTEPDLVMIRDWIERTGIRWGIDAQHRTSFDLPAFDANTWRSGLRRLLLGYALPGDAATLFDDILPVREIEGNLALILGRFVDFAEALFALSGDVRTPRSLAEWERTLRQMLTTFFDENEESADEIRRIRTTLETLSRVQREAEYAAPLSFEVLRAHLAQLLAESDSGAGFLAGRVTFCALKPMRSIPFKVLCLIGMNDTAFPRREAALAFDLVAQKPRPGDRSLRDDDRQLFLESILSARDTLYISYCGRSAKDNSESPPSVLVSELLDYCDQNFVLERGESRKDHLVTQHRLQPFSSEYYRIGGRLFSYSQENARAAEQSRLDREQPPGFASESLPPPDAEWRTLDWERLAEFLSHPAKFFARERLGLRLAEECPPIEECEPQELDHLTRYEFEQTLMRSALGGGAGNELQIFRATGSLPPGYTGEADFRAMRARAEELAAEVRAHISGEPLPPFSVDLPRGEFQLTGTLRDVYPRALLRFRAANVKAKDFLRAWIAHLVLQLVAPAGAPRETLLFARGASWSFSPVTNAGELLADVLSLYEQGLTKPLLFFPETSFEFAQRTLQPGKTRSEPISAARSRWHGGDFKEGEKNEPWLALCFGDAADPLDEAWRTLALRICEPLLAARTEVRP